MVILRTLPDLQRTLDHLPDGQTLSLAGHQVAALFGVDDCTERRLSNFAAGHRCIITQAGRCTVFRKRCG